MLKYSRRVNKYTYILNNQYNITRSITNTNTTSNLNTTNANKLNKISIAFSGCGWLTPFHLGVCNKLKEYDLLKNMEIISGTSGGSLAALIACTTQDFEGQKELLKKLAKDVNFVCNIDKGIRQLMYDILPSNAVELCNNRLHVTVSRIYPKSERKCLIISKFNSTDDIVNAVAASCFIPFYSKRSVYTLLNSNYSESLKNENSNSDSNSSIHPNIQPKYHKYLHDSKDNHFDKVADGFFKGGILPPIGDINVSPYPKKVFEWEKRNKIPDINLEMLQNGDANNANNKYSLGKLLFYSLKPGDPDLIEQLYQDGMSACDLWMKNKKENNNNNLDNLENKDGF